MFKTAKAKKRRFSAVLNVFKRFSNNSKTPPSKIEHKNEIARKTEDFLIFRAIFLTLQFSFTFPFLSHSTQNITHFRHFSPLPIQFYPFPPFSTFLRFPCQLTSVKNGEKNVTFADIAAYTGFSKTTISRYFKAIPLRNWGRVLGELEIMYLFLMLLHLKTSGRDVVHGFKRLSGFLQKT